MCNTKRLEEKLDRLLELMETVAKNTAKIANPRYKVDMRELSIKPTKKDVKYK